ncbi:hypothetical protein [Bradyrhizobium sp. CCBAU 53380]|uniref:hypothetical protein n=1 Tax=Bradyrhizobium sp. CCBAU 53380 TaxID=1325117 RepID=UPI0023028A71|nr:hypothetical protein [Bradyrhizobium sp. CCBAU 53380]
MTFILYGDQWETVDRAIKLAILPRKPGDANRSPQGNALARICEEYLARHVTDG